MTKYFEYFSLVVKKYLNSRLFIFLTKNQLSITLTLIVVAVFFHFPSYDVALFSDEMKENWNAIFRQVEHPFTNHNHLYSHGSHSEKLAFRFVPALIMKVLGIKTLIPVFIFQFCTLILFYLTLVKIFLKLFQDKVKVLLYSLPICFLVSGHVYASDYRGIFDTLSLLFLLLSLLFRDKPLVIVFLLLAYFTDERAIIASPVLILIGLFESQNYNNFRSIVSNSFMGHNKFIWASWLLYIVIRYSLSYQFELQTGGGGINLFFAQINKTFYTFYIGLEGLIIPLFIVIYYLWKKRYYSFSILIASSYLVLCIVAQSVIDINRSMSYSILFIVFILMMFDRLWPQQKVYSIIAIAILLSALYDNSYPLVLQFYRMIFITQSI